MATVGALCSTLALAQPAASAAQAGPGNQDLIVAGPSVRLAERIAGDLLAAGGRLDVSAAVDGDILMAGGELRLGGTFARNAYVAGGRVQIDGELGRNLRAVGGQLELGSQARVAGNATIAGGDVTVRGPIKGSLSIVGGRALIDAVVDGDVTVTARQIELGPQARIGGALRWRSRSDLQRHASAQVAGAVERLALPPGRRTSGAGPGEAGIRPLHDDSGRGSGWWALGWWTLGMMVVAAAVLAAVPRRSADIALTWRQRTGLSLLAGFVAWVCIPVAVLLLFVTVIGVPLGLLALLLYVLLLPMAYVISAIAIGQWGLARWRPELERHLGWRIGAALLALALLALLGAVPWFGVLVGLAALLVGLGAIVLQILPRQVTTPPPSPAGQGAGGAA